jgi:uncharacterized protein (TIGR04255 family)
MQGTNEVEEFLMRFGAEVNHRGFTRAERMLPPGLPFFVNQPIYRFRKSDDSSVVYQIGPGIFTTNGVPPYVSWKKFCPLVEQGIESLLASREADRDEDFASISVRYIDAFSAELTGGVAVADFIRKSLGFDVTLPHGLSRHLRDGAQFKPSYRFQIPMADSMLMTVAIGEGQANGDEAIILDSTVITTASTKSSLEAVMGALHSAQKSLHDMFFDITAPIADEMGVKEEDL